METPIICPLCNKPVNVNTEAHITEPVWPGSDFKIIKHHECPKEEALNE